jgi:hypothetical protein
MHLQYLIDSDWPSPTSPPPHRPLWKELVPRSSQATICRIRQAGLLLAESCTHGVRDIFEREALDWCTHDLGTATRARVAHSRTICVRLFKPLRQASLAEGVSTSRKAVSGA